MAFFAGLFGARSDVYAVRWENVRSGKSGWMPAVEGGWRKGARAEEQRYLPLSAQVLTAHLTGTQHVGLYPMLAGDHTLWLAADFDGQAALLDALAYPLYRETRVKRAQRKGAEAAKKTRLKGRCALRASKGLNPPSPTDLTTASARASAKAQRPQRRT